MRDTITIILFFVSTILLGGAVFELKVNNLNCCALRAMQPFLYRRFRDVSDSRFACRNSCIMRFENCDGEVCSDFHFQQNCCNFATANCNFDSFSQRCLEISSQNA